MHDPQAPFQRVDASAFATSHAYDAGDLGAPKTRSESMRRRLKVFFGVLLLCLAASLSYTFMRAPIYQASARVQVIPAAKAAPGDGVAAPESAQAFLVEVQVLSSRLLLEKVVKRMTEEGYWHDADPDPVQAAQAMLSVTPLEGTQVVLLQAQGGDAQLPARLINTLTEVYRAEQAVVGTSKAQTELGDASDEVRVIEAKLSEKRRAVEAFRQRANIVSTERDENQTLSRLKGLGVSLSDATDREASAAGRLQALEQSIAEGKRAPLAKDNPTVAGIEQRLSQLREEWRVNERQFTPLYLEMDANARNLKARIANLEQQLVVERQSSHQAALAQAKEELAGARATTRRLQQQLADDKSSVQLFGQRFGEYQGMREELAGLEQMLQAARQRVLGMESSERSRKPHIQVLEPAVPPQQAWRPLYWRDAGLSLAASLLIAFLAVWFVEFFNRAEPAPAVPAAVFVSQPWMAGSRALDPRLAYHAAAVGLAQAPQPALLTQALPRELSAVEVQGLLAQASAEHLGLLACLLSGLSEQEVIDLRWGALDGAARTFTLAGDAPRVLRAPAPLLGWMMQAQSAADPQAFIFSQPGNKPLTVDDVRSIVSSSAFDASLEQAQSVDPDALRHTYLAFLVRQGLRFAELNRLVGRLSPDRINALATLAPDVQRVSVDAVETLLPALRVASTA